MADFHESRWEDVQQQPAEEFLGMQCGRATVLGAKRHGLGSDGDESVIREADAMGVAAEVLEEPLRPAEGALHVDEPGSSVEGAEGAACRHRVCGRQLAMGQAALEGGQYLAAKQRPEDTDREEMSLAGRDASGDGRR